jgi:hypothetical protein
MDRRVLATEILVFDIARDCSEEVNFLSLEGKRTKVRVRSTDGEFPPHSNSLPPGERGLGRFPNGNSNSKSESEGYVSS